MHKRVGLMVGSLHGRGGRILSGFRRWVQAHPGWDLVVFEGNPNELARVARNWEGDGMVCAATSREFEEAASSRDMPVVNVAGRVLNHSIVSVLSDHTACGRLAAEHFLDRGFARFCFVGSRETELAEDLAKSFRARCRQDDAHVASIASPLGSEKDLAAWLGNQPRPFALFASSDRQAACVLEACHLAGLRVPEEVAVLGAGNHEELCELCTPALSSIECDLESRGFEAAAQLSRLMSGDPPPGEGVARIAPTGVVTRRSSDTYAFEDPDLGNALRFIHQNAGRSIKVKDVLGATSISRRSLENRFRRYFRRSLHEEIWRVHFERAKQLLTTTDLGLQEVAERSGFRTASALANLFKQKTGLTPRTYRAENRR